MMQFECFHPFLKLYYKQLRCRDSFGLQLDVFSVSEQVNNEQVKSFTFCWNVYTVLAVYTSIV